MQILSRQNCQRFCVIFLPFFFKVIINSTTELTKGKDYELWKDWLGESLLMSDGERWRRTRKLVAPAFNAMRLDAYAEKMDAHIRVSGERLCARNQVGGRSFALQTLVEKIRDAAAAAGGGTIDAQIFINRCSLDIVIDTMMAVQLGAQHGRSLEYVQALDDYNLLNFQRSFHPQWTALGGIFWRLSGNAAKAARALGELKAFTEGVRGA